MWLAPDCGDEQFGLISDERLVKIKQLLFHIVKQNIYERCVLSKNSPKKWELFECQFSTPTLTRKIQNNQKTKTNVHNYNASSIQIHLIWFSSFNTFRAFVRKPKPEKNLQRVITRDRKLISNILCINYMELKKLQMPWKFEQNPCRNEKDIEVSRCVSIKKK